MLAFPSHNASFWLYLSLLLSHVCGFSTLRYQRLSTTFTLNGVHNPNHATDGPAARKKALEKYAHLAKSKFPVRFGPSDEISGFVEQNDREWLCPVMIGNPPQPVNLDFDTGSADLWVFSPTSGVKMGDLGNRSTYDPSNSSTSRLVNGSAWSISYGDGSYAGGKVYTDTVHLGDLSIFNATVEVAGSYSSNLVKDDAPLSGLMGLAINLTTTVHPGMPPILTQLATQGIAHVGVDLKHGSNATYSFGGVDKSAFNGPITYQPVVPDKGYWWIEVTTMRMPKSNKTMVHSWDTIVDTGTSLFLGPEDIVEDYYDGIPSATYSIGDEAYVFHCNETLPEFQFGFADNWSQFTVPGAYMNYSAAPAAGGTWCYGGIQESNMDFSIMGDVFLKAVYVDFNVANQSVGFAAKNQTF